MLQEHTYTVAMMYFSGLLISTLVQFVSSEFVPAQHNRILNGHTARIYDFPFFAETQNCGASILSDQWLLTAAHCVDSPQITRRKIIFAGGDRRGNSKMYHYDDIVIHPKYCNGQLGYISYDIALLKLKTPLTFSDTIKPVKLPQPGAASGNPAHVFVGRGLDETGKPSRSLMKINVNKLNSTECAQVQGVRSRYHTFLSDKSLICVRRIERVPGVCMGDSGSPLLQNGVVMGLASFLPITTRDCTHTNVAFFTNVAPFVPWIQSITGLR